MTPRSLARSVAPGRYFVVTCARAGNKRASCVVAKRRLTVEPSGADGGPAPLGAPPEVPQAAPAAPDDVAPGPVVEDGVTQPVYGYADAIRQRVWVPIEFDTDGTMIDPTGPDFELPAFTPPAAYTSWQNPVTVGIGGVSQYGGTNTLSAPEQDGYALGSLLMSLAVRVNCPVAGS